MMLALAPCTRANGCLRVLAQSHKLGRLEHQQHGGQRIADPMRVELARTSGGLEVRVDFCSEVFVCLYMKLLKHRATELLP